MAAFTPARGMVVEAAPRRSSHRGSWYEAEVLNVGDVGVLVAFHRLEPRQVWLSTKSVRPPPPAQSPDNFLEDVTAGDRLQVLQEGGWWDVNVLAVHGKSATVNYLYYTRNKFKMDLDPSSVRPPWTYRASDSSWRITLNPRKGKPTPFLGASSEIRLVPPEESLVPDRADWLEPPTPPDAARRARGHGLADDGFGPPAAKAHSYAEGTERVGVDGRSWIVTADDGGVHVWTLPGQADLFIERARRERERRAPKTKEQPKAVSGPGARGRAPKRTAEPPGPATKRGSDGEHGENRHKKREGGGDDDEFPCAVDPAVHSMVLAAQSDAHDRALATLRQLLSSGDEGPLPSLDGLVDVAPELASGYKGVSRAREGARFCAKVDDKTIGVCATAVEAAQLRELYKAILSALGGAGGEGAVRRGTAGPARAPGPERAGHRLGRRVQARRQRQHARLASALPAASDSRQPEGR